jgi:hypothetical protein
MRTARLFLALFVCLFSCLPPVFAQQPQSAATISKEATIIIEQNRVRFTAQKSGQEMRLQIFDHAGELVYDSGATSEPEILWSLQNGDGEELNNGLYAYTLTIKESGAETLRARRGHLIVDRVKGRDGADKLWITSQSEGGVGAELTVARDADAVIVGTAAGGERSLGRGPGASRDGDGRAVAAEDQIRSDGGKKALAAAPTGTTGRIAKFTSATEVGDSGITEVNGNVGIGTTEPAGNLHVHGGAGITTSGPGAAFFFRNRETTTNSDYWAWYSQNNVARLWRQGIGDLVSVTDTGETAFSRAISSHVVVQTTGGTNAWAQFRMKTNNQTWAIGSSQNYNADQFYLFDVSKQIIRMMVQPNGGEILFPSPASNHVVVNTSGGTNAWAQYRIRTINQEWTLGASQNYNGDQFYLFDQTRNQPRFTIQPNGGAITFPFGNVGVGSLNPTAKLQVEDVGPVEVAINSRNERAILALGNTLSANRYVWTVESGVRGIPGVFGIYNRVTNRSGLEISGSGLVSVSALQITGGADLSEKFDVAPAGGSTEIQPGMVVTIDPSNPGKLELSRRSYDRRVLGVISGAGGVQPGMLMGQEGTLANGKHPVALSGRVYCQVDAAYGAIKPGDLLTTSPTPGHAMKVRNQPRAHGAIIGKALTGLKSGKGLVLAVVTLQ